MEDWRNKPRTNRRVSEALLLVRAKQKIWAHWLFYSMLFIWPAIMTITNDGMFLLMFSNIAPGYLFVLYSCSLIKNYTPGMISTLSLTPLVFHFLENRAIIPYNILGMWGAIIFTLLGLIIPAFAAALTTQMIIQSSRDEIDDRRRAEAA